MMYERPIPLLSSHNSEQFDCGITALNDFLKKYALQNSKNNSTKTYVSLLSNTKTIVGYYSLSYGSVSHEQATMRVSKGLAKHPIPIIVLGKLAIHKNVQGKGLGKALLKDSILRTLQAANIAGLRAMLVHAKDENARSFYEKFGFEPSPVSPMTLFLLLKDMQKCLI